MLLYYGSGMKRAISQESWEWNIHAVVGKDAGVLRLGGKVELLRILRSHLYIQSIKITYGISGLLED